MLPARTWGSRMFAGLGVCARRAYHHSTPSIFFLTDGDWRGNEAALSYSATPQLLSTAQARKYLPKNETPTHRTRTATGPFAAQVRHCSFSWMATPYCDPCIGVATTPPSAPAALGALFVQTRSWPPRTRTVNDVAIGVSFLTHVGSGLKQN